MSAAMLVIWNPKAGSKAGLPTNTAGEDQLREVLSRHGLEAELFAGESEADAVDRVRRAVDAGVDTVVGAGGDGTVGLVARQLLGTPTTLGILPLGSAMNVARSLGIPRDLDEAAAVLARRDVCDIDVGVARGVVFLEMASVGLTAQMFADAQRVDQGHYGGLLSLARTLLQFKPHRVVLDLDGRTVRTRATMIAVANAPYTGLGLTLAPGARLDDGLFDVAVYGRFPRLELIRHLAGIAMGRRRYSPKITTYHAARVSIRGHHPLPVRVDADDLGFTPASFEVRHAALRAIVGEVPVARDGGGPG